MTRRLLPLLLSFATITTHAQTSAPAGDEMTAAALQAMIAPAVAAGKGDRAKTIDALDTAVEKRWGSLSREPIVVLATPAITVGLFAPYWSFRHALSEQLRKMEAPHEIALGAPHIEIGPSQISAPDFIKVVVQRDGQIIEPTDNGIIPQEFKTSRGGTTVLHAGIVSYPKDAFAPGATVTITLIPQSGENVVRTLDRKELATFK